MPMKNLCFALLLVSCVLFAQQEEKSSKLPSNNSSIIPISVTIGGNFIVTGSFPSYKSQRLDQLITSIFVDANQKAVETLTSLKKATDIEKELPEYPIRDITLKRINGTFLKIDLLKFRLTGDFKDNPYLENDDVIIFPAYDKERNFVDISGAVNKPIKFQFVDGDKIKDALLFAGGINKAFDNVKEAEITRIVNHGTKEEIIKVNLADDFALQRGDRVRILFDENFKMNYKVLVLGEVNIPGEIPITKNNTTLRDVIIKSGGFTNNAWLEKAELLKGTSKDQMLRMKSIKESFVKGERVNSILGEQYLNDPYLEQMKILRMNDLFPEDSLTIIIDNMLRVLQSNRTIDFNKVLQQNSEEGNTVVAEGDVIIIPKREELVYVFGQVSTPSYIPYQKEKSHDYYLAKAGGVGKRAKEDIKIIKGNSYSWVNAADGVKIDAGDFIYVPKNVPKPFEYYLNNIGAVAGIVGSFATLILLIVQSGK